MIKQTRRDSKNDKTYIYYQISGENPKYEKGTVKEATVEVVTSFADRIQPYLPSYL